MTVAGLCPAFLRRPCRAAGGLVAWRILNGSPNTRTVGSDARGSWSRSRFTLVGGSRGRAGFRRDPHSRARMHNLQERRRGYPANRLVVITGPSGSGKSSLAFDTLYAEGQRQYIESLSVYARQFLHQMQRPDVDLIEGLQPTICIDQRPGSANPRSTVATVDRNLRLPAAADGAAGRALLSAVRRADPAAVGRADRGDAGARCRKARS